MIIQHSLALLVGLAFTVSFVDVVFGMGYGTILTPILIVLGVSPLKAVSAVVFSQLIGSIPTIILHHRARNVNLKWGSMDLKVALVLGLSGFIAPILAYVIAINVPVFYMKMYLSLLLLVMGLIILSNALKNIKFSWGKIVLLSFIAGFNKGFTGGGYGPIVTSGQILSGVRVRNAIAITPLARMIACIVTVVAYATGGILGLDLALPLTLGVLLSSPIAVYTVRKSKSLYLKKGIGTITLTLGILVLVKTVFVL